MKICDYVGLTPLSFNYQVGPTGNRTNLSETLNGASRNYGWAYDYLYRLTGETISGAGGVSYGYDAVGNRTNRTSSISVLTNQSASFTSNDWLAADGYDANGSTTNSAGNTYQYDAENRLTNVNNGQVVIRYDGDGNRLSKKVGTITTYYLVDDRNSRGYAQVLEEWTVSGGATNLVKVYDYGHTLIRQRVPTTSTNYFVTDGHGSTRLVVDIGGNVINTFAYDAYGNLIASNATAQTAYLYCAEQFDADLISYYLRARYLNPGTGRFWTMDTSEGEQIDPLSLHKYLYCEANPVNQIDPSGHGDFTIGSFSISANIVVGLAAFSAASIYEAKTHAIGTLLVISYTGFHDAIGSWLDEWKFYNKKQTEAVVTGLIATATTHVGYLEFGKGGGGSNPNDPKDHWRKEIKAALDRAKRLIEKRLTGDKQADLLKQVKDLADKADITLE